MFNLLKGVLHIHDKDFIHRDLKPENVLFSEANDFSSLKIIDFGLSAQFKYNPSFEIDDKIGTLLMMAPE